jgi:hypothetical protein
VLRFCSGNKINERGNNRMGKARVIFCIDPLTKEMKENLEKLVVDRTVGVVAAQRYLLEQKGWKQQDGTKISVTALLWFIFGIMVFLTTLFTINMK